jgi:hypothetical protein
VREGDSFGEADFARRAASGHLAATARRPSEVCELGWAGLQPALERDPDLAARFWRAVCRILERQLRDQLEELCPGTWCLQDPAEAPGRGGGGGRWAAPRQLGLPPEDSEGTC